MKRETSNKIRFILEELIPPIMRDSQAFHYLQRLFWGKHISRLADFRERSALLTPEEYETLYREHPRVHCGTDNSVACIQEILKNLRGNSICDVGCGTGHLLRLIGERYPNKEMTGVDFVIDKSPECDDINYVESKIEELQFDDASFDTVVCTHVIEHLIEPRKAIAELRRITRKRLIIVVPREREYRYSFNPHFNFFPYLGSFLRVVFPVPERFEIRKIGRDIYYHEDISDHTPKA